MWELPEENRVKINRLWQRWNRSTDQEECDRIKREIEILDGTIKEVLPQRRPKVVL